MISLEGKRGEGAPSPRLVLITHARSLLQHAQQSPDRVELLQRPLVTLFGPLTAFAAVPRDLVPCALG